MITLLERIFIKDKSNRSAYGVLCGILGIALNIILCLIKLLAGVLSGSVAISADAINNLSDAGSSLITLIGFKLSSKKPDPEHPFGHGRMEYLSGLLVSLLIIVMGIELAQSSFDKILSPTEITVNLLVIAILLISVFVKLYMAFYNNRIGKKINSAAMIATATDCISDCITTAIVLVTMIINYYTDIVIDGYCGMLVSVFIIFAGLKAAKETVSPLLGQPADPELVKSIEQTALSYDEVLGIHDMVVHDYGPGRIMVTFHAEVPCNGDINVMHDAIDNLEQRLKEEYNCEAVVHMDPINVTDEDVCRMRDVVYALVKEIDESITIHDFRMVTGPTHTNLIFDAVVPHSFNGETVKTQIAEKISGLEGNYFAVIKIDTSFI